MRQWMPQYYRTKPRPKRKTDLIKISVDLSVQRIAYFAPVGSAAASVIVTSQIAYPGLASAVAWWGLGVPVAGDARWLNHQRPAEAGSRGGAGVEDRLVSSRRPDNHADARRG